MWPLETHLLKVWVIAAIKGGFVPALSQALESDFNWQVTPRNYGIAGNTSNQILKRMQEKKDIKRDLKKAK